MDVVDKRKVTTKESGRPRERVVRKVEDHVAARREVVSKITQIIWILGLTNQFLLGLNVILKVIGANPNNGFARLIYAYRDLMLVPFESLIANPSYEYFVLDLKALIAMFVYLFLTWVFAQLIWVIFNQFYTSEAEVVVEE